MEKAIPMTPNLLTEPADGLTAQPLEMIMPDYWSYLLIKGVGT